MVEGCLHSLCAKAGWIEASELYCSELNLLLAAVVVRLCGKGPKPLEPAAQSVPQQDWRASG